MKQWTRLALVVVLLVAPSQLVVAQQEGDADSRMSELPKRGPGYVLLDRDALVPSQSFLVTDEGRTHTSPMATLAAAGAGPGITMVSIGFFPTMAPASFIGNFYTAPADFPTSYYPFFVTGAFAFGTGPPPTVTLGAGVAPAPFPAGTMMWAAFATASLPGPPAMTSGVFGGPGIFPHTPAPTVAVPTGLGVVCGLASVPGPGPGVGALAFPTTPRPARFSFAGPPAATDILTPATFVLPNVVVAGCYISGATVPVELQSYSVE